MIVILGLIVVLGACLVIYYQLGPKTTIRLKGSLLEDRPDDDDPQNGWGPEGEFGRLRRIENKTEGDEGDDKVLYIFGHGEREERSFRGEEGSGEENEEKQGGDK